MDALAISSYLAPRNPEHEQRALRLARESHQTSPSLAGATLSSQLDSIRRATTATLNAKLLGVTGELLERAGATLGAATRRVARRRWSSAATRP